MRHRQPHMLFHLNQRRIIWFSKVTSYHNLFYNKSFNKELVVNTFFQNKVSNKNHSRKCNPWSVFYQPRKCSYYFILFRWLLFLVFLIFFQACCLLKYIEAECIIRPMSSYDNRQSRSNWYNDNSNCYFLTRVINIEWDEISETLWTYLVLRIHNGSVYSNHSEGDCEMKFKQKVGALVARWVFIGSLECCYFNSNTLLYTYMHIYIHSYLLC